MPSTAAGRSRAPASRPHGVFPGLGFTLSALGLAAWTCWALAPPGLEGFESRPRPAADLAEALRRIEELRATDSHDLNPVCRLRLMSHGRRTGRVVVLLHGLTNCPQQFEALGKILHARGANVLIARIPHHGLADRMTDDLAHLTAEELVGFGDRVIDIARGLGDSITVAGLSLGAVAAAWIAQRRSDVDRAVAIAPVLGVPNLWPPRTPALTRLLLWLPNHFVWWDRQRREAIPGPSYVYPRFSTRALGQALRLGLAVTKAARRTGPSAAAVALVTVEGDPAISNSAVRALEQLWRHGAPGRVKAFEFPRHLGVGHDLIDVLQPYQRSDVVYPVLVDLMCR